MTLQLCMSWWLRCTSSCPSDWMEM